MEKNTHHPFEKQKRIRRQKLRLGEGDAYNNTVVRTNVGNNNVNSKQKSSYEPIELLPFNKRHKLMNEKELIKAEDGRSEHTDQFGLVKVEVEEEQQAQRGGNTVYQSPTNGNLHGVGEGMSHQGSPAGGGSQFQQNGSSQSPQKYFLVERGDVPPVQQQYVLSSQYNNNNGTSGTGPVQRDCDALNLTQSAGVIQRSNSEVPILKKEVGPFRFTVELDEKEDTNKTPSWLINSKNKLYTNINKAVPFHVKLGEWPEQEHEYQVRVTAVFSSHQYARAHVKRCPIHASPQHQTNIDFPFPEHVVRLDHPNALYEKSSSGRLSVVVPLEQPQAGPLGDTMPLLLRFMCLCSCSGGINRRPLAIIFTLEKHICITGKRKLDLYGRQTVDVRVCACPMRDYRNEEGNLPRQDRRCGRKRGGRVASTNVHHYSGSSSGGSNDRASALFASKLDLMTGEDLGATVDELYTIPVRGVKLYEFLMEMKASYLRLHPEYSAQYPDIEDEVLKFDGNIDEDQKVEDESISVCQDISDDQANYNNVQQLQVAAPPQSSRQSGCSGPRSKGVVVKSDPSESNLVINYNDVEMAEHDYSSEACPSTFSTSSQHSPSTNRPSFPSRYANSPSVGPLQPQNTAAQFVPHQLTTTTGPVTSNIVTHPQIIGPMKTAKSLPSGLITNGTNTSSSPLFLIVNPNTMENPQLTFNGRKILVPRPPLMDQQAVLKTTNSTIVVPSSTVSSNGAMDTSSGTSDDNNSDVKDGLKKNSSVDSEDNSKPAQFRHIPMTAVTRNPSKDPHRKGLCVTKKVPRVKSIPGKLVSQEGHSPMGVGMPMFVSPQQVGHIIPSSECGPTNSGGGQYLLTRTSSGSGTSQHQILVPLSQSHLSAGDMKEYPNLVVKREPHDYDEDADDFHNIRNKERNMAHSPLPEHHERSSMNGRPGKDELLAAQVLASNMGSRQFSTSVSS